jgi:hypothetical protein
MRCLRNHNNGGAPDQPAQTPLLHEITRGGRARTAIDKPKANPEQSNRRSHDIGLVKDKRANSTAPATPNNVTAHGATQQTPNASARALKPTAPPVTPRTLGFSLIALMVDPVVATDSSDF